MSADDEIISQDTNATILLMGLKRSGKSSICKVVFQNMQPLDTLYLESTSKPTMETFKSLIDIGVMELPGQLNLFEPSLYDSQNLFASVGALVYVIDSQDEYLSAIQNLAVIVSYAYSVNPDIQIGVLIHKIDGLSDDFRLDTQRDIMGRVGDVLLDLGLEGVQVSFYLTSIFDYSIYEAFSRIVQKLIKELPYLEPMLDALMDNCNFDKVFLVDVNSKIYVATNSSPVEMQTYESCAEFIDVTMDLDGIYGMTDLVNKNNSGAIKNSMEDEPTIDSAIVAKPVRCMSTLQNGSMLYLHRMIRGLALVAVHRQGTDAGSRNGSSVSGSQSKSISVIDYNVSVFKKSLEKMWESSRVSVE
ncbi:hypothetical protein B5S28_g2494 [[Candida] boidinii]|nr:hypothetical protein B5S28_g2494 [[Candida] boidinii]OWB59310.1 hypothetical protein B5S29_g165 [[Candida] boidinii]OWB70354.1 hypothetical protein B5S31_g31 [[Candida] boidinii]OWB75985.1 hypothetical protein B5S32_g132 [[Candida] boidinii]